MKTGTTYSLPRGFKVRGKAYEYTILDMLGQGSFGITYLATTHVSGPLGEIEVPVAIKEFFAKELNSRHDDGSVSSPSSSSMAAKYGKAFKKESENLSKMKHPGIVKVLEAFEANGTYYYAMEYLSGGSLDELVKGKGLPEAEAIPLIVKIGEAVQYMHDWKVMHLDLKPKNIMMRKDGSPIVIDFGLSKQYDSNGEPESSSSIGMGTPGYAPLEQANQSASRDFQPTLDVYALGATLFKMLSGMTPAVASVIFNDGFDEKPLRDKGVSDKVIDAIKQAMSPAKKSRPQSISAFLAILNAGNNPGEEDLLDEKTLFDKAAEMKKTLPESDGEERSQSMKKSDFLDSKESSSRASSSSVAFDNKESKQGENASKGGLSFIQKVAILLCIGVTATLGVFYFQSDSCVRKLVDFAEPDSGYSMSNKGRKNLINNIRDKLNDPVTMLAAIQPGLDSLMSSHPLVVDDITFRYKKLDSLGKEDPTFYDLKEDTKAEGILYIYPTIRCLYEIPPGENGVKDSVKVSISYNSRSDFRVVYDYYADFTKYPRGTITDDGPSVRQDYMKLSGWGNKSGNNYASGKVEFEFLYKGVCIASKSFTLK